MDDCIQRNNNTQQNEVAVKTRTRKNRVCKSLTIKELETLICVTALRYRFVRCSSVVVGGFQRWRLLPLQNVVR